MLVGHRAAEVAVSVDGAGGAYVHLNVPFLVQAHGPYGEGFGVAFLLVVHLYGHVGLLAVVVGTVQEAPRLAEDFADIVVYGVARQAVGFRQLDQFGVHFCLHFKFSDSIDCFILSLISSGETS